MSSRPACGFLYSGMSFGPTASSSTIGGTPTRNTEPHQKWSSSTPPMIGPKMAPIEKAPATTPMAVARCFASRNMLLTSESVEGPSVAPATPSTALARIRVIGLLE